VDADLVRATLTYNIADAVHFFLDQQESTSLPVAGAFQELRNDFGEARLRLRNRTEIPAITQEEQLLFFVQPPTLDRAAQVRHRTRPHAFPLCTIVHGVPTPEWMMWYVGALLLGESYDSMVVTSRAGRKALTDCFENIQDYVFRRSGAMLPRQFQFAEIPLGVDDTFLQARNREWCRQSLALPADACILLYVGRLSETYKMDLEPLLRVFARLRENSPSLHLVIAGKEGQEQYSKKLESLIAAWRIEQHVTIFRDFPFFIKPLLYSAADVFVSPSDNIQETFGVALLEAMACGLPVVASDWSGYRDLVVDGQTGFLIPTLSSNAVAEYASGGVSCLEGHAKEHFLAQRTVINLGVLQDRLASLIRNVEVRRRMGDEAVRHVRANFAWSKVIRRFGELWSEQLSILDRDSQLAVDGRSLCDLTDFMRAFSTELVDDVVAVRTTQAGEKLLDQIKSNGHLSVPMGLSRTDAFRILDENRNGKCAESSSAQGPEVANTLFWLLKKGYVERLEECAAGAATTGCS
jgi:glycosyltransferase involved in cell wall biosynthesis